MKLLAGILLSIFCSTAIAQSTEIEGLVSHNGRAVPFANISVSGTNHGASADPNGRFSLKLKSEKAELIIQAIGFKTRKIKIDPRDYEAELLTIQMEEDALGLDQVVISATRNRIDLKQAPVIVNVLNSKLFNATQSASVAETLNFQPGVRVETNCQNCGFTQVRLNGLDGSYTQILINSRSVFSALNSVYGLEQIPTSILDRVEVVRSGGSALFGSNAIAGTINIITKEPVLNTWNIASNLSLIDGEIPDRTLNFAGSVVAEDLNSGVTIYGMNRDRSAFDANGDGFTEITELTNNTLGAKAFFKPDELSKLSLDLTALKEYRKGGDRLELPPHLTDITEQLDHNTFIGGLTYDFSNVERTNNYSVYVSGQHTDRKSYYGGLGGGRTAQDSISASNAYGNTTDLALLGGFQFTRNFANNDVLTTGVEYNHSNTEDDIAGYNRYIDQKVNSYAAFAQYEWKPVENFTALLGARLDHINITGNYAVEDISRFSIIDQTVLSPRITILYDITEELQFRGGYARGFRAPQAFNEDLHISSVGGEPQFVILSNDLETEYSNAYTASFNYSFSKNKLQTDFLLEGFFTELQDPFTTVSTGASLPNGSILKEVRNGSGAYVTGTNFEIGVSPNSDLTFQLGGTYQRSIYKEDQILFEADPNSGSEQDIIISEFVRNPDFYGYLNVNTSPFEGFAVDLTGTYTGKMTIPRVINPNGMLDLIESPTFWDMNIKLSQHIDITENFHINLSTGVQNVFNEYQDDFDSGPTRDSDFIYGPSRPRTFFFGIKFGNLHE
ncbi:outer membrane receptor for ferrienterochelin and colicins [Christiangramia gaetbulicola]|uniref:Outer membrane receptor for ferrienterochelin and colicins n=1 Tax=Christiangramia gaetbulicola TaxID=703340 RepID=A0A2T6AMU5_9FLAO|nr:TonB-dependent receptor [Christiangramia gaetbulicola]PTX45138.1 outer membrane receptor for ferrienterochelin and colicins [Christiangramia gaetbulicola]